MRNKQRSEEVLDRLGLRLIVIKVFGKLWASLWPYHDPHSAMHCSYASTMTNDNHWQCLYYDAPTTFKIILRCYTDLEDCNDDIPMMVPIIWHVLYASDMIFCKRSTCILGFKHIFQLQTSTLSSNAYLTLLQPQKNVGWNLTHSHTMTPFDAPGKQAFWKHCGKRRNCS